MTHFYGIHGLVIGSEIELPELELRRRPQPTEPDVTIAVSEMTSVPQLGAAEGARVETEGGEALMTVPGVAIYRIQDGTQVVVQPDSTADPALVRLYILGPALALICHQRGLLPLHASAVEIDGEIVAFVGSPGEGKSTIAAHCLAREGTRFAADDILVVTFPETGRPLAHPGMPSLKLWRDALDVLGRRHDDLRRDWLRAEKFHLPMAARLLQGPLPLKQIYVLDDDPGIEDGVRIEPIIGGDAVATLIVHTFRIQSLDDRVQRSRHFVASSRLAGLVPVRRLARRKERAQAGVTAAAVLADVRSAT
jgi:hypothetical protein